MSAAPRRPTLLVTGAAGPAGRALGAQLALRAAGTDPWHVVGVDLAPTSVPGYDRVEPAPAADAPGYERGMLDLIQRHGPDLVVPTVSEELARISVLGLAAGLGESLVVSAPGPAAVAADKLLTTWELAGRGVPVPRHAPVGELGSAAEALSWGGGPVVVKPRVSRGGRGVHVLEHADDPVWAGLDDSWIVQEFAPGTEYSPQVHRGLDGGPAVVVVLEKTALESGRVGNATAVTRLTEGAADDIAQVARDTVAALDLVGPVDMDVRRRADGTPVVLEVNARFGAVSAHAPELLDAVLGRRP